MVRYAGLEDFELVFPSGFTRKIFHEYVTQLLSRKNEHIHDNSDDRGPVRYEFESDEHNQRVILGRGSFGCVYSALDLDSKKLVRLRNPWSHACDLVQYRS